MYTIYYMNSQRLQKLIVILFHLLFMTVPFFFTWVNEELFEFPKMLLTYGFTVLIVGLWVSRMILEKKIIVRQTVFDWPILFFVVSQTLSTIFSIHPPTSVMGYYTRFHGGLLSTLTYTLLFYALVSNFSKPALRKLWLSIFIAALGVTLYALPEHFGRSPSCLIIAQNFDVSCWIQDVKSRVFATFGQPNWLAAYTITLIPLGILSFAQSKKRWQQGLFGLTTLTLFLTLLFTQSRSGLMGFGVSMILVGVGLAWLKYQNRNKSTPLLYKSLSLIGVLAVALLLTGSSFTPAISQLLQPPPLASPAPQPTAQPVNRLEVGGTDSGEIRKIVWQGAVEVWKRYPLLGSGVETFAYSYYQDRPAAHNLVSEWDFLYNKAHNELLNFLATTGMVGLLSYLLLLGWLGIVSLHYIIGRQRTTNLSDQLMMLGLLSGVVALSVSNFFGFSTVVVSLLLLTSLGSIAVMVTPKKIEPATTKHITPSTTQFIQLSILSIVAIVSLSQVIKIWRADKAYAAGKDYIEAGYAEHGLERLQTTIKLRPREALYHNQLADAYSKVAVALNQQNQSTASAEFKQAALAESALTLQLNPRHLNFHKARARILINLSSIDPTLLIQAKEALLVGLKLAPTDAKLMYNLGLVEISIDQVEAGIETLRKTIAMKPNYEAARVALGKQYEQQQQHQLALEQYQYVYDHITQTNQEVNQKLTELK